MLAEIQLKFHRRKGAWLQETSERHPSALFVVASLYQAGDDVHLSLVVQAPTPDLVARIEEEWIKDSRLKSLVRLHESPSEGRFHFVYPKDYSTLPLVAPFNLFSFRFAAVSRGDQYLSIIAAKPEIARLVKALEGHGTVEVVSLHSVKAGATLEDSRPVVPLFKDLTEAQLESLQLAYGRGYYRWPRQVSAKQLAKDVGMTLPSFLRHLRGAEQKLITASMSELERQGLFQR